MRIVQVANFYGKHSGGLRTTLEALGEGYQAAGHERVLIVPGPHDDDQQSPAGRRITIRSPVVPGLGGYRAILNWHQVARLIADLQADRIEVSDKLSLWPLGPWAARRGVPAVLLSHERMDAVLAVRFPGWFPLRAASDVWNRQLASAFARIVCASSFSRAEWERIGATNVTTMPLGVDLDRFTPGDPCQRRPGEVVCVGRLSREKRPDLAIAAVAEMTKARVPVRLTMVGAGPQWAALASASKDLPVRFVGHVDQPELAGLLRSAAVALAPCPHEAFGLSVLEAMASGTPVVTTNGGAAPELLSPGCGLAVPARPIALAAALVKLLRGPGGGVHHAARTQAERYPWSATVEGMLAVHGLPALDREAVAA